MSDCLQLCICTRVKLSHPLRICHFGDKKKKQVKSETVEERKTRLKNKIPEARLKI